MPSSVTDAGGAAALIVLMRCARAAAGIQVRSVTAAMEYHRSRSLKRWRIIVQMVRTAWSSAGYYQAGVVDFPLQVFTGEDGFDPRRFILRAGGVDAVFLLRLIH